MMYMKINFLELWMCEFMYFRFRNNSSFIKNVVHLIFTYECFEGDC